MSQTWNDPPILMEELDRGLTLPARWYTDPDIIEREQQFIFARSWAYVGPAKELRNVGDYITGSIGGRIPIVVTRDASGLNAMVNICRHRRHEVIKGRGNAPVMRCSYHGWTYNLAGCLQGAPRSAEEAGFRLAD